MMPGKVNPSQIEALCMVCAQVMGHDLAIGIAACQGQLELNTYKPLIALNALDSARLLSDAMDSFARHCVAGLRANLPHMAHMLEQSLCDVMALVPHLGHDEAARIARHAQTEGVSLKQAAWALADVAPCSTPGCGPRGSAMPRPRVCKPLPSRPTIHAPPIWRAFQAFEAHADRPVAPTRS
jgi:fumarate hydratase class II